MPDDAGEDRDEQKIKQEMDRPKIDLSRGTFNIDEIYHDEKFKDMLKEGLSGVVHDREERQAIIRTFFLNRKHGLSRSEMKKALRELRDSGEISELTEMRVRREFGIY
ncbi:MAG: hypothetical protein ACM3NH_00200 [Candidatus Saccharibacteria bacterium]